MTTTGFPTLFRWLHRRERGQVFLMVALLIAVFGGMTAIAIDLGSYSADRRDLQNAADAIALAASRELPDASAAQAVADQWAVKNGIDPAAMTVTIIPQGPGEPNPKVIVEIERDHDFTFARLVGVASAEVGARAAAIRTSPAGGDGVVPLSVTQAALAGATYGDQVILKYDANDIFNGNTGPIRIDNPGSGNCISTDNYCTGVKYGSNTEVCADGADTTYCDGATVVDSEPGNKIGPTRTAINYRMDNTDAACDEFGEVFEDDPTTSETGVYHMVQECNPFLPGGYSSLRVLIIPVIEQFCNGSCAVRIVDFALFFVEGFAGNGNSGCAGNECQVVGRFVRVNQNVGLLAGTFDPNSSNQFVRLVE